MPSGTIACVVHGDRDGATNRYNYGGVLSTGFKQYNQTLYINAGNKANWEFSNNGEGNGNWNLVTNNLTSSSLTKIESANGSKTCINGTFLRTILYGGGNQRWLSSESTGFEIDWYYDRDGNNALVPWKFGAWFEDKNGADWKWSSADVARGKKETWYRFSGSYDSATIRKLEQGFCLKYIMINVGSNRHGTGGACRTSEVHLRNLRFKWATLSGKKLLLPATRTSPSSRYYRD